MLLHVRTEPCLPVVVVKGSRPEVSVNLSITSISEQGREPVEQQGSINPQLVKFSNTVNQICRKYIAMIGKVSILIGGLILAYAAFSHRDCKFDYIFALVLSCLLLIKWIQM